MDSQSKTLSYAGFWKRFVSFVIDDIFVLSIIGFFIGFIFGVPYDVLTGKAGIIDFLGDYFIYSILSFLLFWIYHAVMESSVKQATLGKMALGIVITDLDGNRLSFGRASGRHFGKILSGLILGVGFILIALTSKKQAWHDIIADTLVINRND